MRIQFCHNCIEDFIAEFEVVKAPTTLQCELIENEIYTAMDEWEKEHGDFEGFDFWECCYNATNKHIGVAYNPVVATIYI